MAPISIGFVIATVIIALLFIILFRHLNEFMKDEAPDNPVKPYSLGRVLLFYWTVLIISSICYLGIYQGAMPAVNDDVLLLMGIVAGTTGTARVIDYVQISNGVIRHQNVIPGQNLLMDIISDNNGLSIHRFQVVLFNILYGIYFISDVFGNHQMPMFSDAALGLLGISSGTYALLKIPENPSTNTVSGMPQTTTPVATTTTVTTADTSGNTTVSQTVPVASDTTITQPVNS